MTLMSRSRNLLQRYLASGGSDDASQIRLVRRPRDIKRRYLALHRTRGMRIQCQEAELPLRVMEVIRPGVVPCRLTGVGLTEVAATWIVAVERRPVATPVATLEVKDQDRGVEVTPEVVATWAVAAPPLAVTTLPAVEAILSRLRATL